ncbi:hypothetical protein PCE1_001741 [Barthelona sp. PCE]
MHVESQESNVYDRQNGPIDGFIEESSSNAGQNRRRQLLKDIQINATTLASESQAEAPILSREQFRFVMGRLVHVIFSGIRLYEPEECLDFSRLTLIFSRIALVLLPTFIAAFCTLLSINPYVCIGIIFFIILIAFVFIQRLSLLAWVTVFKNHGRGRKVTVWSLIFFPVTLISVVVSSVLLIPCHFLFGLPILLPVAQIPPIYSFKTFVVSETPEKSPAYRKLFQQIQTMFTSWSLYSLENHFLAVVPETGHVILGECRFKNFNSEQIVLRGLELQDVTSCHAVETRALFNKIKERKKVGLVLQYICSKFLDIDVYQNQALPTLKNADPSLFWGLFIKCLYYHANAVHYDDDKVAFSDLTNLQVDDFDFMFKNVRGECISALLDRLGCMNAFDYYDNLFRLASFNDCDEDEFTVREKQIISNAAKSSIFLAYIEVLMMGKPSEYDSYSFVDFLEGCLFDWNICLKGEKSPTNSKKTIFFDIGGDKWSSVSITPQTAEVYIAIINSSLVRFHHAALRFEMCFCGVNDEERYSMQSNESYYRNLIMSAARQPFGYPVTENVVSKTF